ncbi:MAG: hypothetical protein HC772_08230 [Leptolyngbyaceae cyanobacterium CRU_2_3]|nr:hypothetical protein [Leptolyngbyaceae cyanobacterium CRU_2_3]
MLWRFSTAVACLAIVFSNTVVIVGGSLWAIAPALALPPPEDIPEEVLRTEIITEARSPIDGQPMTAAEYAELEAQIQTAPYPPMLPQRYRDLVTLLRLRQAIRSVFPFLLR